MWSKDTNDRDPSVDPAAAHRWYACRTSADRIRSWQ